MAQNFEMSQAQKENVAQRIEEDERNDELLYAMTVNIVPPNGAKFEVHNSRKYAEYMEATQNGRMNIILDESQGFNYQAHTEAEVLREYHKNMLDKIKSDVELANYYQYTKHIKTVKKSTFALIGKKLFNNIKHRRESDPGKWPAERTNSEKEFDKFVKSPEFAQFLNSISYTPPHLRIMLLENLTFNIHDPIPVFSDLEANLSPEYVWEIPKSLSYLYGDTNVSYAGKNKDLAKAAILAAQKENNICCDCHSTEPIVPCSENENCRCFQMNLKLRAIRDKSWRKAKNPRKAPPTTMSTFEPILFAEQEGVFFENVGFACSVDCACKGRCTNNPLLLIEKHVFPLEIYRESKILGFGVRTLATIPAGTPIMEFVGEVVEKKDMKNENDDYAYELIGKSSDEPVVWKTLMESHPWSQEYKELLKTFSTKKFFVDPKNYGNVGRTAIHSCSPNTEVIRIFQRSVSPLHARLIFVTLENVYAGTPLTLDYGADYVKNQFGDNCLCNSFACVRHVNSPSSNFSKEQLAMCFELAEEHQKKKFEEMMKENANDNRKRAHSPDLDGAGPSNKQ